MSEPKEPTNEELNKQAAEKAEEQQKVAHEGDAKPEEKPANHGKHKK